MVAFIVPVTQFILNISRTRYCQILVIRPPFRKTTGLAISLENCIARRVCLCTFIVLYNLLSVFSGIFYVEHTEAAAFKVLK